MAPWRPLKRRELVARLRDLGFTGPFSGGKHQFMTRRGIVVTIPNPHRGDIGIDLLRIILKEAGVSSQEWHAR